MKANLSAARSSLPLAHVSGEGQEMTVASGAIATASATQAKRELLTHDGEEVLRRTASQTRIGVLEATRSSAAMPTTTRLPWTSVIGQTGEFCFQIC